MGPALVPMSVSCDNSRWRVLPHRRQAHGTTAVSETVVVRYVAQSAKRLWRFAFVGFRVGVNRSMRLEPLSDKVVIKRLEADDKTAGGIVLPDSAMEKPQQGRVLSVGDGRLLPDGERAPHQVSEGDRVLFTSFAGNELIVDDEEVLIMSEDDILAVLD